MTSHTRTKAACLADAMVTRPVVDVTDAMKFPNIRAVINHLASLSDERLAELEWKP